MKFVGRVAVIKTGQDDFNIAERVAGKHAPHGGGYGSE
jgi:hypothetical protein